jgi:hypothetical protein
MGLFDLIPGVRDLPTPLRFLLVIIVVGGLVWFAVPAVLAILPQALPGQLGILLIGLMIGIVAVAVQRAGKTSAPPSPKRMIQPYLAGGGRDEPNGGGEAAAPKRISRQIKTRLALGSVVAGSLVAFGFALAVHWPWLQAENDRLEPISRVLIWLGDAAALLWLIWFGVKYSILGHHLPDTQYGDPEFRYLLVTLLVAFGIDIAITVSAVYDEDAGRERATQSAGDIVAGRPTANGELAYILCRFQDQDGVWHKSHLQVGLSDQPLATRKAIQQGMFPLPVRVRYDPHWPPRY